MQSYDYTLELDLDLIYKLNVKCWENCRKMNFRKSKEEIQKQKRNFAQKEKSKIPGKNKLYQKVDVKEIS